MWKDGPGADRELRTCENCGEVIGEDSCIFCELENIQEHPCGSCGRLIGVRYSLCENCPRPKSSYSYPSYYHPLSDNERKTKRRKGETEEERKERIRIYNREYARKRRKREKIKFNF